MNSLTQKYLEFSLLSTNLWSKTSFQNDKIKYEDVTRQEEKWINLTWSCELGPNFRLGDTDRQLAVLLLLSLLFLIVNTSKVWQTRNQWNHINLLISLRNIINRNNCFMNMVRSAKEYFKLVCHTHTYIYLVSTVYGMC